MLRRNKDQAKLFQVVETLLAGRPLPAKHRDHPLTGNWTNRRDCHIEPDWLLIYQLRGDDLILERTGSHSDLYG